MRRGIAVIAIAITTLFGSSVTRAHAAQDRHPAGLASRARQLAAQLRAQAGSREAQREIASMRTASIAEPDLTVTDAVGDEGPDVNAAGDITAVGFRGDASQFAFAMRLSNPVNPSTDSTWRAGNSFAQWAADDDFDGQDDKTVLMASDSSGHLFAGVATGTGAFDCFGSAAYLGNHDYQVTFAASCFAGAGQFRWWAEIDYVTDVNTDAFAQDDAPDSGYTGITRAVQGAPLNGYWMLGSDGHVYPFGSATAGTDLVPLATGFAPRKDGTGYWRTDWFGHVFSHGRARYRGGTPALVRGEVITTMAATPTDNGYWLFSNFGRVFPFGDASFLGDMRNKHLNGPVIASAVTPTGNGYYMVGSDGGIFTFGDAHFRGSKGGQHLNAPIVGIAATPDNGGYWLVGADGGVFTFGDAPFRGSMGGRMLNAPVNGLVAYGNGYLMVAADGGVFTFSNKHFLGSLGGQHLAAPIIGISTFFVA
jgi:hypothetical protein